MIYWKSDRIMITMKGDEETNMCLAIEEMRNESRLEGEIMGAVETCRNFNMTLEEIIQYISDNFTVQQAEEEVKKYWK